MGTPKTTTAPTRAQALQSAIQRVALYARVSTLNGQHPEMQLSELREFAARRGWSVAAEYVDEGVSGSKESRPALNRLMADAHHRRFDAVLVWKIDRFGRSLKHLVNAIADLTAYGVAFVSLRDNIDLSTPSGRLMLQIIGAMAEFELSLTQERVKAGLANAQAHGVQLGRPRRVVDAASIRRMKAEGVSLRAIATRLGIGYGTARARVAERKTHSPGAASGAESQALAS
jgi:DNA invertase Pin-like site-specific DNA recombinase